MGVETRKGRLYLYERRRIDGRRRTEYVGPLSAAEAAILNRRAAVERDRLVTARADVRAAEAAASAVLAVGTGFDRLADQVFRAVMHLTGYRCHHRGEWRRARGVQPMASMWDIIDACGPKKPKPGLINPVGCTPEQKALLERAAAGDRSALPAVWELLKDPLYLEWLGGVAGMAQAGLVAQAAGDNLAIAEAVREKIEEYVKKLLADGPEPATYAERLAAKRAAHNWVCVHILECKMTRHEAGGERAAGLDKALCRAERRLQLSLKSLAVLRRLRRPAKKTQVNVANGPMLVDNRGSSAGAG